MSTANVEHVRAAARHPQERASLKALQVGVALVAFALGAVIAWHDPIGPLAASAVYAAWTALLLRWRDGWLFALMAVLPIAGLAPHTGWITFEEFDFLALGAIAGAYAQNAFDRGDADASTRHAVPGGVWLIVPYAIAMLLSLYRGMAAAGGALGWYQGYHDAMNSVRLAKPLLLALLALPPAMAAFHRNEDRGGRFLCAGITAGLLLAGLAVVSERLAFTGLLDFSSDYRATGSFWEMHVGGAALDGYLALAMPFAALLILESRRRSAMILAACALAAGAYATLVTFTRSTYAAIPVALAVLAVGRRWQRRGRPDDSAHPLSLGKAAGFCVLAAAMTWLAFRHGGYRAVAAAGGVFVVWLAVPALTARLGIAKSLTAMAAGAFAGVVVVALALLLPRSVYAAYAAVFAIAFASAVRGYRGGGNVVVIIALGGFAAAAVCAIGVAAHWGGADAGWDMATVVGGILVALGWRMRGAIAHAHDPLPELRKLAILAIAAGLVSGIVATFQGGDYMATRFESVGADLAERRSHWGNSMRLLRSATDRIIGRGLGRFPADYIASIASNDIPGSYRIAADAGAPVLILGGAQREGGFGEMLRFAQEVPAAGRTLVAYLDAKAPQPVTLQVGVCARHLLYSDGCALKNVKVGASSPGLQRFVLPLDATPIAGGSWYAPRPTFFELSVDSMRQVVEIARVQLVDHSGRQLLANGDWSQGSAHWFIISEREHLPWHIKNMALHLLFEQGIAGLALLAIVTIAALARLSFGAARQSPLAAAIVAALAGYFVVGLFDSMLDVPRTAFMFYFVVLLAWAIPPARPGAARSAAA